MRRKLFVSLLVLLFIGVFSGNILAQSEPDYPESLGRCLGVYQINSKFIPEEFSDFEYFYFDNFPDQDTDKPKRDAENRVFIQGKIKLTDNTVLKIKKAFVRSITIDGDEDYYKDIYFETKMVNGLSYKFKGEFLEKRVQEEKGSYTKAKGVLTKYKNGEKIAEAKLKFYEYAEL